MFSVCFLCVLIEVFGKQQLLTEASKILLLPEPSSIIDGVTKRFQLTCSFKPPQPNEAASYVSVNSISLKRGDANTLASISSQQKASYSGDASYTGNSNIPTVQGNLSGHSNYLQLTWSKPGTKQSGQYTCVINATDNAGQVTLFDSKIFIYYLRPEKDMVKYVTDLEEKLSRLQIKVEELDLIQSAQNRTQSYQQEQLDALMLHDTNTAAALQRLEAGSSSLRHNASALQSTLDSFVIEEGVVTADTSTDLDNGVPIREREAVFNITFTKKFSKVPSIVTSLLNVDANEKTNLRFRIIVADVTTAGFTLKLQAWFDTVIYELKVKWRASVP